ncbi:MAG TPA: EAL domain-containing protein [Allosphingosinicella sp.]|nr:EAL domain-containing protein [Allosphingosinicella sp.]
MGTHARLWMSRLFDTGEARTAFGRALLDERYRALQRQIPLLYAIALANFVGLYVAGGAEPTSLVHPATFLIGFVVVRLVYWLRTRRRVLPPAEILKELRRTLILAGLLSIAFGYSAISIYGQSDPREQELVILFASLAAIGCAYGLTSFPAAARLPLLLFALPLAVRLAASGVPAHAGVGISLALITLMILRLVDLHNEGFVQLVRSRSEVETERERAQRAEQAALAEKARVRLVADTDPLTGLANRRAFLAELEQRLAAPASLTAFALALLDLDGFKPVNDTFGHAAGDALLIEVAARLRREAGAEALTARIGGDEFALILPCGNEATAMRIGERISAALERPYLVDGREFRISACCGVNMVQRGCDLTTVLSQGDAALYAGKQRGRGCVALFTPAIAEANRRRIAIERALREPGVTEEIGLAFQPIFDLSTGALRAFEALARWHQPALGPITPAEFIPITEQINVIEQISDSLLARACAEAACWPAAVRLSFNLSAIQLCSANSAARLLAIAAAAGIEASRLQFEVTETAMLVDFGAARLNLERLRAAGARIALDDFGAGFASISYLREIIFDTIKLDGALVTGAAESDAGERLLRGVLGLCASLQVPCVAEHIEHPEQIAMLRALKCRDGQGYALAPPLLVEEAHNLAAAKLVPFPSRKTRIWRRAAA